jgi:hypothetical protein
MRTSIPLLGMLGLLAALTACNDGWKNTEATPEPTVKKSESIGYRYSGYDERYTYEHRTPGKPANWSELGTTKNQPVTGNQVSPVVQKGGTGSDQRSSPNVAPHLRGKIE